MYGPDYYIPSVGLGLAFVCKLPGAIREWRDPLVRSVSVLLGLAAAVFFFAAPPTIAEVNRITGITNFSGPLVYAILTAFAASTLVLVVNWRGGAPKETRRTVRRVVIGYSLISVAIIVLFALGDAPVERLRDLDTYYANTPFIREMIVLYLLAEAGAAYGVCALCWRWSRQVDGRWLRSSLMVIVIAFLFNLASASAKLTAVGARWAGFDLDTLSTNASPILAAVGALIAVVGFLLPLLGPRFSDSCGAWLTHWRLGRLWRELRAAAKDAPAGGVAVRLSWWAAPELLVTLRETEIHDGLLGLQPYFDEGIRSRSYDAALAGGASAAEAEVLADAAMVAAAAQL
ncbi:hypothetical protein P8605_25610, partial [Streptomyces sp. T-3]|nr:hypothetical protein [Streptomyces sp. T-3]